MKNKIFIGFLLAVFAMVGFSFNSSKTTVFQDETGVTTMVKDFFSPGIQYSKVWTRDTISNAEQDTLLLTGPLANLNSGFQYNYVIQRTNLSGTVNVGMILQESNETSGTANWYTVATTGTTSATTDKLQSPYTYGKRQRIIVSGGAVSQSTWYIVSLLLKQTNGG